MPYAASDFTQAWKNVPAGISSKNENHRRHILDKEVLADLLNIAKITLTESEMEKIRNVINDGSINMHPYLSKSANVGNSEKYAAENDCQEKTVSDRSAVLKVRESFETGKKVHLTSHEASHIIAQVDLLLSDEFKEALSRKKYEYVMTTYRLYTHNVYGPEEDSRHGDGKLIDERKLPVSAEAKEAVRHNAYAYLKALEVDTANEKNAAQSTAISLASQAQSLKTSNDAKYTAMVSYESGRGRGSGHDDITSLMSSLSHMNLSNKSGGQPWLYPASSHNYYPSLSSLSSSSPAVSSAVHSFHPQSSVNVSLSQAVNHNYPTTRSGSNWDYFRSNVWTGGSRADMSRAYADWKSNL